MATRSPSHPSVSLAVAIERAKQFHETWGCSEIDLKDTFNSWGYKPRSGAGNQLVAAMTSFGLLDSSGKGQQRLLKISDIALSGLFVRNPGTDSASSVIPELVLKPAVYQVLWERWGFDLPSTLKIKNFLVGELDFNKKTVERFLRDYLDSIGLARDHGLIDPGSGPRIDDTNLEFSDESLVQQEPPEAPIVEYRGDDTDLDYEAAKEGSIIDLTRVDSGAPFRGGDTDLKYETHDVTLRGGPKIGAETVKGIVDFAFEGVGPGEMAFPESGYQVGESDQQEDSNLLKYFVAANQNITLQTDGRLNREAIQSLIDQLKLDLESGRFDD